MENVWILAQAESDQAPEQIQSAPGGGTATTIQQTPDANAPGAQSQKPRSFDPTQLIFLVFLFVIMYFLLFRGPRRQQQQHRQLVQSLKKNDRVRTIGGIFGTVVEVKGDEVILKVDESSNTKLRISTSAISKNLSEEGKEKE
jgi:preprotein translocase subunit YajC